MKLAAKLLALLLLASTLACKTSGTSTPAAGLPRYDGGTGANTTAVIGDLVVCRPIGVFASAGGTMLFLLSLPFTWPAGSIEASAQTLVHQPLYYTFERPLGDFND